MSAAEGKATPHDASAARAAHREWLAAGTRLDDFEIVRTIGSGGFGTVYLARDRALEREVAIKEFLPTQLAFRANGLRVAVRSPDLESTYSAGLRSFVNEAKILARLNHPAVVKVHRFWEDNGTAYMVMPYVRGPRLRDVRRSMRAAPSEAWLRSVMDPLLDALAMLHAEGIYHRDIAPDNILLPNAGQPVLLDFGAARRVIGDRTQTLTAVLKPNYAPIEQYAEAVSLRQGPWTDLYALGAVVTYLLRALPPPPATVRALQDDVGMLTQHPLPGVSMSFLAAIEWALAVRPQDRPHSVDEFVRALDGETTPPPRTAGHPTAAPRSPAVPDIAIEPAPAREADVPVPHATPRYAIDEGTAIYPRAEGATWDTTLRLASTVAPTPPPMSAGQKARSSARLAFAMAMVAFVGVAAALVSMLRGVPVELDASTWRELASQAAHPDGVRDVQLASTDDGPRVVTVVDEPALPLKNVATERAPGPEPAAAARSVNAGPLSIPRDVAALRPSDKRFSSRPVRRAATAAHAKTRRPRLLSPREACSDHGFFTIDFCMVRKCEDPPYRGHPACVALQRQREERTRRFDHP